MVFLKSSGILLVFVFVFFFVIPSIEVDREVRVGEFAVIYHGTVLDKPSKPDLDYLINNPAVKNVRWLVPVSASEAGKYRFYEWDRDRGWVATGGIVY